MGWTSKPDMTAQNEAAKAQTDIARENQDMAREQIAYQREQDALWAPIYRNLVDSQVQSQKTADQRSADQWSRYLEAFAPAENKLAEQALNYDTAGRRQQAADEAVAGVDLQFNRARQAQQRDLGRAGVSLDSGRALTLDMAGRYSQAKAAAGADRTARQQVENTGMSLVDNVAKLGRGLAGTSLQAQGLGLQAGGAAGGTIGGSIAAHNAGLQPALQFGQAATSGFGNAANIYGNIAQQQAQANQGAMGGLAGLGGLAGTLLTAGTGSIAGKLLGLSDPKMLGLSDPKTKVRHGKVNDKAALAKVTSKPVEKWTYKPGMGDGGTHVGRMAGKGDVSTPQGKAIDVVSELGLHQASIRALTKEVASLKTALKKDRKTDAADDAADDANEREAA